MYEPLILTPGAIQTLAEDLSRRGGASLDRRLIVGIAGVPGAGKSTLAQRLIECLDAIDGGGAVLISMDGFHLTNAELHELALSGRKGAPETFDAARFLSTLSRYRDPLQTGTFPIYDRELHEPVEPGEPPHVVTERTRVILTEGNYLLLDEPPWDTLGGVLDEAWWLETPMARARQWLIARHLRGGRTEAEAEQRWVNDARNARRAMQEMREPDRVLCWPDV